MNIETRYPLFLFALSLSLAGCGLGQTSTPATDSVPLPTATGVQLFNPLVPAPGPGSSTEAADKAGGGSSSAPYPAGGQGREEVDMEQGPAFVDESELLKTADPLQVELRLAGTLPTPCHVLDWEIQPPDEDGLLKVEVFSLFNPEELCVQMLEPFETRLPLTDLSPGGYRVQINGEDAGEFELNDTIGYP